MTNPRRLAALVCAVLLLTGCMTTSKMNAIMDSWLGKSASELVATWGPPTNIMDDGDGMKIYVYDYSGSMTMPGVATTNMNYTGYGMATATTTYGPSMSVPIRRYRMFWINRNRNVVKWSYQGL